MQPARVLCVLAQRLAQQARDAVQHARGDVPVAPHGIQDLVPGEHLAG